MTLRARAEFPQGWSAPGHDVNPTKGDRPGKGAISNVDRPEEDSKKAMECGL